jgi:putative oxidoreductase
MSRKLATFAPQILGLTRILVGILFVCHGAQKVLGAFGGIPAGTPAFIVWVAGGIELMGGALVALGLLTHVAAFVSSGLMAAAYFMGHAPLGLWPILNGGEPAILYCWLFLNLAALGPGAWAIDNLLARESRVSVRQTQRPAASARA